MEIEIKKEDIAHGIRKVPQRCPLANAIKRKTGAGFVSVGRTECLVGDDIDGDSTVYWLDSDAQEFVECYDRRGRAKPCTVNLARGEVLAGE